MISFVFRIITLFLLLSSMTFGFIYLFLGSPMKIGAFYGSKMLKISRFLPLY